ncbi:MAG: beta-ketoacyl-ACP synthase [Leptolyngbyaceae cyanobacterium SM1_1_3]|nr:beta-ketoacyl-ACP synthase [Leptolyngbyaceae cyanobacterium SM1_1_3]NJN04069.1 beta-ketoacyl-ACP synthase [Leptolyngbyaceae cyanobacterium RM1_1_2]NJO10968.1 beta-ketoacyl-ACP synthase [Leptolyngbyaceae cyanobacterium SL_1_1]
MDVVITGIGLTTALGSGIEVNWKRLLAGESAIALLQPFRDLPAKPLALIGSHPACLNQILHETVASAIADASLQSPLPECGVAVGSSRSHQNIWEQLAAQKFESFKPAGQTATDWLASLPHSPAVAVAQQIQTQAPVLAPMSACATGLWSVIQGAGLIVNGHCDRAIVGAVEAPVTPLTLAGFDKMGTLAKTGCYPFDCQREGLVLGEGAAAIILESSAVAHQRQAKIYAQLLGFGATADGYHLTSPDPHSKLGLAAIKTCLQRSRLAAQEIDYIHAHGTSTQRNDAYEARLIQALFPQGVAVSSTKGATGHTLGASGAIGLVFCLLALKHQFLPPCTGLQSPAFDLNLVTQAQPHPLRNILCLSFGFGGQNVAIAVGK